MTAKERFNRALRGQGGLDRLPAIEWATHWDKTVRCWQQQGLPTGLANHQIHQANGLDPMLQIWVGPRAASCPAPAGHGAPLMEDEADFEQLLEHLFPEENLRRAHQQALEYKALCEGGDYIFWMTLEGFFWFPRTLFGIENHLYAFYDYPELMHEMNRRLAEYNKRAIEAVCSVLQPDFMTFAEDMSYNNGPMLSRRHFDEFLAPYYRQVIPLLKQRDIPVIVDTDGDLTQMIPWLLSVGIEGVLPLERQAGVDVNSIRELYPDFMMIGGYDKTIMHLGEEALRREFERIRPAATAGRYIPSVDHQTPPNVSLEDYRLYVRLLKEYMADFAR